MSEAFVPEKIPALSLQQPWAHLVACGFKDLEFRSKPSKYRGPVYLYASKGQSLDLAAYCIEMLGMSDQNYTEWMPRGVIVGRAVISDCAQDDVNTDRYVWVFDEPELLEEYIDPPSGVQPQPGFWYPFGKPE